MIGRAGRTHRAPRTTRSRRARTPQGAPTHADSTRVRRRSAAVVAMSSSRPVESVGADDWNAHSLGAGTSPAGTDVASLSSLEDGGGGAHNARSPQLAPAVRWPVTQTRLLAVLFTDVVGSTTWRAS